MKRELAFALEARSQFSGFIGRTRSSKSPPPQFTKRKSKERLSNDRSKISIDEVNMSRRSKRVKTSIPDGDSINVDRSTGDEESLKMKAGKSEEESVAAEVAMVEEAADALVAMGEKESAASEVVMGEEESAAPEVAMREEESTAAAAAKGEEESAAVEADKGEEQSAAVEADKGEEDGTRTTKKVYVKRKHRKDKVNSSTPKRFTRSALKETEDNVEKLGTPTRKNLELKMSKKIGLSRVPINMRELLETGLLEGFQVSYNFEGSNLQGVIKGTGILCSCKSCKGTKVIAPSKFEFHACDQYRHAIKYICLENGKSLLELLEICKSSALESLEVAFENVITSLPVKKVKEPSICTDCNGPIESSSTENILKCDTCLNQKIQNQNQKQEQVVALAATNVEVEDRPSSPVLKAITNTELPVLSEKKRGRGRPRKSDSVLNSPKSAKSGKLSRSKIKDKILKKFRSPRSTSVQKPPGSAFSSQQKSGKKLTIKNQQLHWPVFEEGGLPDGTELTYVSHGKKLLDGYKLGHGIFCSCCKTEISASQFEAHAGWPTRKKPYENIYISNGVSLHEYAVSLKRAENKKCPVKFNDDLCRICWDGGNLLLCDGCPRSFHKECTDEKEIPQGKWYCRFCKQAMKVGEDSENATVAGRVEGIDLIEQITKRCIRIVKTPENIDLVACVLCRGHDFSKNVFNERTVIVCDQCEREYHIGCLREQKMADLEALPKGKWFCRTDCERIHSVLQNLLTKEAEIVDDDLLTFVREKQKEKEEKEKAEKEKEKEKEEGDKDNNVISDEDKEKDKNVILDKEKEKEKNVISGEDKEKDKDVISEMKFVLLSGKNVTRENRPMLTQTINIFHEGFDPIIDATSGRDFIPSMVYGRKIWSQDFAGMLCAILTIDSNVVSAGTLRVFGQDIAELPIVATSKCNQGKGYFHVLFSCIERLLSSLNIKKLVLPAADEAKSIWTKLGFQTIEPEELGDLRRRCSAMMTFKGTSMLQKDLTAKPQNGGQVEGHVQKVDNIGDVDIQKVGGE